MPETVTATSDFAAAPISLWRRGVNSFATLAAAGAVVLVLLPLGAVFGYLIYKGIGSINWAFLTQTPKPVGEAGGGMANAIAGSAFILLIASVIRRADRNRRGNLSRGIWPQPFRRLDSLHRRRTEWRAFDRGRHRGLWNRGAVAGTFLGVGRRSRAGNHDDSDHHSHHRRDASARAATRCGKRLTVWASRAGAPRCRLLCVPPRRA